MKLTYLRNESDLTLDEVFQTYLDHCYEGTTAQIQYSNQQSKIFRDQKICVTYGELLFSSLKHLLSTLDLNEDDVLLDMGAGLGKLVMMSFYLGPMRYVRGIEGSLSLYEQSLPPLSRLKEDCPALFTGLRHISLEYGNFLDADLSDVTVAYSCSTCFSQSLLFEMGYQFNKFKNIRYVLSLRPIPSLTRLKFKRVIEVECSWDSALCYVYA